MALGTRSGGGALRKQECCMPLLQALDEKSSKLEDFWNAKTEVVRNKLDRHGAGDTSWIDSIAMCPVYYPTKEDFMQDPLCYIQKIAAEASKFGMCKIVSPVVASVPAGMVLSKEQSGFKFTTRIQPLRLSNWDKDDKITFPMSGRNYTLTEYEKMANRVFSRKFSTAGNLPPRFIESEFWKELAFGKTRTVEYATDVEGSAFSSSSMDPLGQSKWNLKEISRLPYSTLRLLEDAIPGVTEPMLYIGMLFSMFSWHIEDHYLYSINYQHCGAPKTWYGVPGDAALCFEKVVQEQVYNSELLQDTGKGAELDLLLEKTTLFTPKLLAEQGVPVFKAVQYPGEFIVTFPRAYHAGFSHGFNCGEAVNFAMADWFLLGAEACLRYEFLNRFPLLPHEMLLCKEAAIISQINQTGHENSSCELQSHVKVAFVACVQSLLQSISSLKKQGAKITTSNETSVFCGLCKHSCYVAYTSCKCFPEPTCFNHGEFFSICTCKSERIIVLKDEFADLEAVAQKYECEVEIMSRVQKLVSHYDSLETKDGSRFAQDVHFEKSSLIDAKDSGECCKTQEEKEKADNGGVNAQVESGNGVMSSVCTLGQEEELSDTEVVQFKRRKVSLSQKKHFQVDEQEITPERHILTLKNTNCPKVESSCLTAREYSLGLEALDRQAVVSVAEVDKAAISTTHESFDTTSDSEVMSKRKKLQGALVKVKRKRSVAIVKDLLLAAEFNIERAVKQAEESEYADFRNCSDLMVGSTRSSDSSVPTSKEGQNQEVEEKGMERTQCMETWNKDDNLQGRAELLKIDTSSVNKNHTEHSSSAVLRIEADPPFEITRNLTDERNLIEDSTNWNSRTVVSNSAEVDTRGSATVSHDDDAFVTTPKAAVRIETDPPFEIARSLTDEINLIEDSTNWNSRNVISNLIKVDTRESATVSNDDDACVIIPTASVADEGKPFHTEGCSSSCEYRECEAGPFVLRNGCSVISSPAEAQPLAGLVEVQKAESNAPNTEANIMPLKDCGKSMPKKGLVIHLNRKAEQVHKQKVADVFYDEDKSSICENLMEQVNILEGQSEGSAWCLDQEVVSSYSDQNNCKWFSPSGPSTLICGDDLIEDSSKFVKNEESSKRKCLLDMGQLTVGQQEAGNVLGLQDDLGFKFHKPASHSEFYDYANRWQIHEGESSSTQYSYAMPSLVPGCAPATIEGVSENINVKNAIPPAECCKWQKSEIASHSTSKGPRGLSSAGVCVPGDDYLQKFSSSDASLDTRSSGLDSSTLHQSEGHASNFVGKPLYQTRNFGAVDFDMFPGQSTNWRQRHLQGHADFSARHSTGGANNYPRVGPSNNYKSRSRYRNHRPFQHDNVRTMKYPRTFHKKPSCHEERRPRRHFSQGWRGGSLENNRRQFGADNPRMKGMLDTGFSAASSSAGSVHDEGYDPMKWEISPPVTNPWQFSSIVHHVSSGWAEQRL